MKLYWLALVKGKQLFKIGDNIKDHLEDKSDFKYKVLLDWGNFNEISKDIEEMGLVCKLKTGNYQDPLTGRFTPPKNEKDLINNCIVICSSTGRIYGIAEINKNNRGDLR